MEFPTLLLHDQHVTLYKFDLLHTEKRRLRAHLTSKSGHKHTRGFTMKLYELEGQHSSVYNLDGVRSRIREPVPALTDGANRNFHTWNLFIQSVRYSEENSEEAVERR